MGMKKKSRAAKKKMKKKKAKLKKKAAKLKKQRKKMKRQKTEMKKQMKQQQLKQNEAVYRAMVQGLLVDGNVSKRVRKLAGMYKESLGISDKIHSAVLKVFTWTDEDWE